MFSRAKLIITAVAISLLFAGSGEAKTMPPGFFGVLPQEALHKQDYDIMQFIGMETIRIPMSWGVVEGTRGTYDWGAYDAAVRSASERDINLFVTLYSSPGWVGDYRILPVRGDASKRWKRFVHAAVSRYGANGNYWFENPDVPYNPVDEWQIWNEVNYKYFSLPVSARNYGILVRDTAPVIRRADSNSKVILSGLYSKPGRGDGIPAGAFLAQASRIKGFARSYDAASIHPYTITPTIAMNQIWVFRKTMNLLARTYKTKRVRIVKRVRGKRKVVFKKVRKSYPLRPKSLYITEIGWGSDSKTAFGRGSEEGQAQAVKNIYAALVKHQAPLRLKGVHWFTWKDLPTTNKSCAFCYNNGFLNLSGGGKQALSAFIPFLLSHGYKNKSR